MDRVLLLRGGALGDFVVTLPALALLRQHWPCARIELAGNATAAQLAVARGVIDQVHSQHEARWAGLFGATTLACDFATWLASFDVIISYWPDPECELRRRFPLRPGQRFLSAPAVPSCAPAAAHYCEALRPLGIEPRDYFFPLAPLPSTSFTSNRHATECRDVSLQWPQDDTAPSGARNIIAVHPGSGSRRKNWPVENWRALIASLPAPVSVVLGEAEMETWNAGSPSGHRVRLGAREGAASRDPGGTFERVNCLVNQPLEKLVIHFSRCRLFLGHDSGISHLAAACGARCVLLFGPTDPAVWAPPSPAVRVLHHPSDLSTLPLAVVQRAVAEALGGQT